MWTMVPFLISLALIAHLKVGIHSFPIPQLRRSFSNIQRGVYEILQGGNYSEYGRLHDALGDQSVNLEKLIGEVEHQGVKLVNQSMSCLCQSRQGLAIMSPTAEAMDQIHELLPASVGERMAAQMDRAAQNGQRLIFYEYDSLRLEILKKRCEEL